MDSNVPLSHQFFKELRQYNSTNFRTLTRIDLLDNEIDAITHKSFSSVVTRFWIFIEKHPELSETDKRVLFFMLKLDTVCRYFSQYPSGKLEDLRAFQRELQEYVRESRLMDNEEVGTDNADATISSLTVSDFTMGSVAAGAEQ